MNCIELVKPIQTLADSYIELCAEEIALDSRLSELLPKTRCEASEYIRKCELQEQQGDEDLEYVPQSTFWLVRDGIDVIGESRLRHRLTASMESYAGHICYGIRVSERRKGYGSYLLKLTLERARSLGISPIIVICRKDNIASIGVIDNNGGVFQSEGENPNTGKSILRYRFS